MDIKPFKLFSPFMKTPIVHLINFAISRYCGHEKKALSLYLKFTLNELHKAFLRKRPVVWTNAFVAQEFLYGLGFVPIFPEVLAGIIASIGLGGRYVSIGEKVYSSDICSFYKAVFGMIEEDVLPRPDLIISTSHICNGAVKFFEETSRIYKVPFYLINIPYGKTEEDVEYLAKQLRDLRKQIKANDNNDNMEEAIFYSNKAREYMGKINGLRKKTPAPMHGHESLGYVLAMYFTCWGSKEGTEFYAALYKELMKRKNEKERFRLLWLHHVRPYYKSGIMDWLQERKAIIVMDESSYLWETLDERKPYISLAKKMLSHLYGIVERRIELVNGLVEDYRIDGVIHLSQWGCRQSCGGAPMIKNFLNEKDIPMLILHNDCIDERNYGREQTRTRIDAFLEILEGKR